MLWAGGTLILYPKTLLKSLLEPKVEFFPMQLSSFQSVVQGPPESPLKRFLRAQTIFMILLRQHLPLLNVVFPSIGLLSNFQRDDFTSLLSGSISLNLLKHIFIFSSAYNYYQKQRLVFRVASSELSV